MKHITLASILLLAGIGACAAAEQTPPTSTPSTSGRPSAVLNESQCQNVWTQAAGTKATISGAQAEKYLTNFKQADVNPNDGQISKTEFEAACQQGLVQNTAMPAHQ